MDCIWIDRANSRNIVSGGVSYDYGRVIVSVYDVFRMYTDYVVETDGFRWDIRLSNYDGDETATSPEDVDGILRSITGVLGVEAEYLIDTASELVHIASRIDWVVHIASRIDWEDAV